MKLRLFCFIMNLGEMHVGHKTLYRCTIKLAIMGRVLRQTSSRDKDHMDQRQARVEEQINFTNPTTKHFGPFQDHHTFQMENLCKLFCPVCGCPFLIRILSTFTKSSKTATPACTSLWQAHLGGKPVCWQHISMEGSFSVYQIIWTQEMMTEPNFVSIYCLLKVTGVSVTFLRNRMKISVKETKSSRNQSKKVAFSRKKLIMRSSRPPPTWRNQSWKQGMAWTNICRRSNSPHDFHLRTAYLQSLSQTPGQVHVLTFPNSAGSLNQVVGIKVAKEVGAFPLVVLSEATQVFQPVHCAAIFVVIGDLHPKKVCCFGNNTNGSKWKISKPTVFVNQAETLSRASGRSWKTKSPFSTK